jgi:hypothetical protein
MTGEQGERSKGVVRCLRESDASSEQEARVRSINSRSSWRLLSIFFICQRRYKVFPLYVFPSTSTHRLQHFLRPGNFSHSSLVMYALPKRYYDLEEARRRAMTEELALQLEELGPTRGHRLWKLRTGV